MTLEVTVEGVDDSRTVSSLDEDSEEEVAVEPRKPPALDAGGGVIVDGDQVVEVKVDDVDDVGDGDRGVEVMVSATDGLDGLESVVDGSFDGLEETVLAMCWRYLKKKQRHH